MIISDRNDGKTRVIKKLIGLKTVSGKAGKGVREVYEVMTSTKNKEVISIEYGKVYWALDQWPHGNVAAGELIEAFVHLSNAVSRQVRNNSLK